MGAARVRELGPVHLTLTAEDGLEAARAMPNAAIVSLHFEGWTHFSEGRSVAVTAPYMHDGSKDTRDEVVDLGGGERTYRTVASLRNDARPVTTQSNTTSLAAPSQSAETSASRFLGPSNLSCVVLEFRHAPGRISASDELP